MDSWAWTNEEEEPPFPGLPPLPKVFRDLSPSSLPEKGGQEEIKPLQQESCSSHQDNLTWLHREMNSYTVPLASLEVGRKAKFCSFPPSVTLRYEAPRPLVVGACRWIEDNLQLRLVDVALFNQLYTLALEIQDLKELQQETESFFKEEFLTEEARGLHLAMRTRSAATPFELSI